jgi:hypothetical protein
LFAEYTAEEFLSIKELMKIFKKNPLKLKHVDAEDLSRFLIEPREKSIVVYNKYAEKLMIDVRMKFDTFLNIDYPSNLSAEIPKIKESLFGVRIWIEYE